MLRTQNRGTWLVPRAGQAAIHRHHSEEMGSSLNLLKCQILHLGRSIPEHQDVMGPPDWKAALQKSPQRFWWARRQNLTLQQGMLMSLGLH